VGNVNVVVHFNIYLNWDHFWQSYGQKNNLGIFVIFAFLTLTFDLSRFKT